MSNGLGFSWASHSVRYVLTEMVHFYLVDIEPKHIVTTGFLVADAVEAFKTDKPDKVPKMVGGLLGPSTVPVDDFKLAEMLFPKNDLVSALMVAKKVAAPQLLSYIAIKLSGTEVISPIWAESALQYVANKAKERHQILDIWNKRLEVEIERQKPLASVGEKFVKGRKKESIGPLRLAIRKRLKSHQRENAAAIWKAFSCKPPKGLNFYDNRTGKYVEYDKRAHSGNIKNTSYGRFGNIVSEEVKRLVNLHGLANP